MFIRVVKKQRSKEAKIFFQYNLVQASRIGDKVKQRVILYLGSSPLLADKENKEQILSILKSKIFRQPELFPADCKPDIKKLGCQLYEKYLIRYGLTKESETVETSLSSLPSIPPLPRLADYHKVDLKGLEVSETRSFGGEHLCKQVLVQLGLEDFLKGCKMNKKQIANSLIAIASRALFAASEYKTTQFLSQNSSLMELYQMSDKIDHRTLYKTCDMLYERRKEIDHFLYQRVTDMFSLDDKIVIFDISNTYFETSKQDSALAKYGRSKEKRSDCPLVVFTGVINPSGFIRHSRIYEGNCADVTTLEDMLEDMETNGGVSEKKTVVIDAGIADETNLALLRTKGYHYVCVSRQRLKEYEMVEKKSVLQWTEGGKQSVKLNVFRPKGYEDTWMYVESEQKRKKEQSMKKKLTERFIEDLGVVQAGLSKKGGTKRIEKVWERIGRVKEKHHHVSGNYEIKVNEELGKATLMSWEEKPTPKKRQEKEKGVYFIRTNYENTDEKELWKVYNTIREVERTFRCLKTDLNIRPVHHQKDERIASHIYLTVLAYQLVNTIQYMLREKGIRHEWREIVRIMSTQMIQTIRVPTDKQTIHIRQPSKPIKEVLDIYQATRTQSTQSQKKKYVVYH